MKTKEKIIHTAVEMFNAKGFAGVSLGDISQHLKISKGNLTYHFKNRGELLKAIYDQMFLEMEGFVQAQKASPLVLLAQLPSISQQFTYRYRFFFASLVPLCQEFPWVATRHQEVVDLRIKMGTSLLHALAASGHFLPESTPGAFERLAHLVWLTTTFWYVQHPILPPNHPAHHPKALTEAISTLIQPYLSPSGLVEWHKLNSIDHESDQN